MPYHVVYSLPRDTYTPRALFALVGVVLFLFGRALWRRVEATDVWDWLGQLFLPGFLQIGGALTVGLFFVAPTVQALYLGIRVARGHYLIVTGTVTAFHPGDGHASEEWTVVGKDGPHTYSYNPNELTPGFAKIRAEGGPIRDGLRVRVADVDGHIARLEVQADSS